MENHSNPGNLGNHQTVQQLENRWKDVRNSYSKRYPFLTDEDLTYRDGEFDAMTERIAQRTKRSRDEVRTEIRKGIGTIIICRKQKFKFVIVFNKQTFLITL